jgi:hypothetical protein
MFNRHTDKEEIGRMRVSPTEIDDAILNMGWKGTRVMRIPP